MTEKSRKSRLTKPARSKPVRSLPAKLTLSKPNAEALKTLKTVRDVLRYALSRFNEANLFFGHGSTNAYDEAAYLLLHTLNLPLDELQPYLDAALLPSELKAVLSVVETRAAQRVPAAYLTREAWLGDFHFYVDARVIVPRSFIAEHLRAQLVPWVKAPDEVASVLELCTGSGCLAVLAAHAFPAAFVDAVDLSADALAVATINVAEYGLQERVELLKSDLFKAVAGRKYDVILANPPYVDAPSMQALPGEYLHEPRMALASGKDGLQHTHAILAQAKQFLNKNGVLMVEIGHNRDVLEAAYPHLPFNWLPTASGDDFVFLLRAKDL
jgi:ribosomal protein L3 glutamine methyltransferase